MKKRTWSIIVLAVILFFSLMFVMQEFTAIKPFAAFINFFNSGLFGASKQTWPSAEKQLNIFIRDQEFLPNATAAKVGVRETWYNEDAIIHVVSGEGWSSDQIPPGQIFNKVFNSPGTYEYRCSIHPEMTGKIIIH